MTERAPAPPRRRDTLRAVTVAEDPDDDEAAARRFEQLADGENWLTRSRFVDALSVHDSHAARRMFSLFDADHDGAISREEFIAVFEKMARGSEHEKLDLMFHAHDTNGDGQLDRREVERMIVAGTSSYGLDLPAAAIERLVDALFAEADPERTDGITREAFGRLVHRFPDVLAAVSSNESAHVLTGSTRGRARLREDPWPARLLEWARMHPLELSFTALLFLAVSGLFVNAVLGYRAAGANAMVQVARGGGAALELCGALLLVPMLRRTMTWLRRQRIGRFLPLDASVGFHVLVAYTALALGLLHTAAHVANYHATSGGWAGVVAGIGTTSAGASGLGVLLAFVVMVWFSRPGVRRSGRFETFHRSHLLYLAWFPLMLLHGPTFWIWVTAPLASYGIERWQRARRANQTCPVLELEALRSGVTRVVVETHPDWKHEAGDYVFVRIPEIAPHEWHPFTISSAPELEGRLELHVRSAGNWTRALYRRAEARIELGEIHVDGPFGTPSAHIFDCSRVVLVGAGIGVTPFAAILQSIHERSRDADDESPVPAHVDFVWLAHDQYAFEWFTQRLAELESAHTRSALAYHLYLTGSRVAMTTSSLALAREILHRTEGRDLWTGLAARTQFGHPVWSNLLAQIRAQAGDEEVQLFFCGPLSLVPTLRSACRKHGIGFRHEVF